jgi:hypothetical protein
MDWADAKRSDGNCVQLRILPSAFEDLDHDRDLCHRSICTQLEVLLLRRVYAMNRVDLSSTASALWKPRQQSDELALPAGARLAEDLLQALPRVTLTDAQVCSSALHGSPRG